MIPVNQGLNEIQAYQQLPQWAQTASHANDYVDKESYLQGGFLPQFNAFEQQYGPGFTPYAYGQGGQDPYKFNALGGQTIQQAGHFGQGNKSGIGSNYQGTFWQGPSQLSGITGQQMSGGAQQYLPMASKQQIDFLRQNSKNFGNSYGQTPVGSTQYYVNLARSLGLDLGGDIDNMSSWDSGAHSVLNAAQGQIKGLNDFYNNNLSSSGVNYQDYLNQAYQGGY